MLTQLKNLGRAIIPKSLFQALQPTYHGLMASLASAYFGNPSQKLFVIGVTGTAGKSTTVMMLSHILNRSDKKTGYITTVGSSDGTKETINKHGLSMPGGWLLQKTLRELLDNGCTNAIVECTSEGLAQNRHKGIHFSAGLFTNLSPAHLDAHGSFENYRAAKGKLFSQLRSGIIGVNLDDPSKNFFLDFPSAVKFGVSMRADTDKPEFKTYEAKEVSVSNHTTFNVEGIPFTLPLLGTFNVLNAMLAIGMADQLGITFIQSAQALASFGRVPGRMETFTTKNGATVIVDYAPEPAAMEASLRAVQLIPHSQIIHVFGSTGGHRDKAKRFEFGRISGKLADKIIITNDDVYDSDPEEIARNIREGIAQLEGQQRAKNIETILDRKQAIAQAIQIAEPSDVVLVTGKGSEQFLVLPENNRIDWDEREIVKGLIA
jgi:UDP-N-acetylmuramoyl-L-alanyl-D-glutamate--2,6-diaminopimelate ligase